MHMPRKTGFLCPRKFEIRYRGIVNLFLYKELATIWHEVTNNEVKNYSLSIADKVAVTESSVPISPERS